MFHVVIAGCDRSILLSKPQYLLQLFEIARSVQTDR